MSAEIKKRLSALGPDGQNAYEHLKQLVTNLALNQQGLDSFEEYSFDTRGHPQEDIVFKVRESYGHMK